MSPVADPISAKYLYLGWAVSLLTGVEVTILDLANFIFGLSFQGSRLE